ncbi:alpha/beta hydrolase [Comamonas sp. JC664]|uniref:alpha/beta fold hydrolase n=1 Tax=Comamonas sp. JC664 TaxID=2801917 RepID=UPI00174D4948|nr:alpha/beta hydrolase [Comamonas sp. JC664]MBL0692844.1 alpha/beta hydrolase [Comamonas sp. JC664]GHG90817.1 alpha/beta hydrolase [Comamonas sp. KCTC 72670]
MTHASPTPRISRRRILQASAALPAVACVSREARPLPPPSPVHFTQHRFTSADGTSLSYFRHGEGPPLVWIHGALSLWSDWRDAVRHLSPGFTHYVLERRGRGYSADGATYSLEREVEDVLALMKRAGPDAALFGHSYGGVLALEAARQVAPAKLLLYEPPFPITQPVSGPALAEFERALSQEGPDAALVVFNREVLHTPEPELEAFRQTPQWSRQVEMTPRFARELRALEGLPLGLEAYREVRLPTLVLLGARSPEVLLAQPCRALVTALANARLSVLAGQGHVAHVTAPALLAREVSAFLRE